MLTSGLVKKEVFAIRFGGRTLFYAPLTRNFAVYDGVCSLDEIDKQWLKNATSIINVPNFIRDNGFVYDKDKIRLRLNITTKCNLTCSYCSVRANDGSKNMSEKIALCAVKSFCKFAKKNKAKTLEMVFSGGEPTLRIDLIKVCIANVKSQLADGIRFNPRLLTNGVFNPGEYARIMKDIEEVQVSWDGFFGSNQRYGLNSRLAAHVWNNICFLIKHRINISVLVVVSETNFLRIREVVDQLYECGVKHVFLGIRESLGYVSDKKLKIDYKKLGDIYFELWKDYRMIGVDINLTGTDIHSVSPFPCSVPIPNYSISPEGVISACTISFNDKDVNAKIFEIGRINKGRMVINRDSINNVRKFNILNIVGCESCFAKWHCRGGCIYAKNGEWFAPLNQERCEMIRDVVVRKLLFAASE